ncbi:putative vacuolar segregation protein pep7 protein [Phaeoacremonium minimum UCRPA7]|uniref:Putative vacuolar segregation protein pep7 protein n=1 Tax=Phaeoacremonium minimum (strain UCR-PA7) TaxID=1286976 RepID=R8BJA3_PHAM7|nr:putative vacuolar segregation protein pep7 protein [Phaeoacremonium minimum UCRPA7]EON99396.1 putative vacuolar segregation protein pep7 protein [Phaeoacremonium minimum UCRPA7]
MLTLLQLNRHIDDAHQELPEFEQDEVKTWFDKQVLKAKRFQPLSIINSKLRGLEVFESNESLPLAAPQLPTAGPRPVDAVIDPEELVTRKHWQRPTGNDMCTDPPCGKRLGPLNGSVNCRKCGRLFCEEHTMYQIKLSRSAAHDPVRGYWCRVCETCYKTRDGYNDHNGVLIDHTNDFISIRRKKVERHNLEIQRLEKRLTKLTQLLANPPEEVATNGGGLLSPVTSLAGQRNPRKLLEQSVVTWEDDASVAKCPFCQQEFGSWSFRRHHCRICGRVVCADPQTGCSSEVGLSVASATPTLQGSEKTGNSAAAQVSIDIRMCRDCKSTIFSKRDFTESIVHKPPDQKAYETLRQFERGIRQLMPSFQRALLALQPPDDEFSLEKPPPTHAQIQEAAKIRKRLTDSFTKYDLAAKRIRDMKTTSQTQLRLQKAIYAAASTFLHTHMLPLKSVPRMLKEHSASRSNHRRLLSAIDRTGSGVNHLSPLRNGESADSETASLAGGSETSTVVSALETEEKELRERLVVLEEQRFMVKDMIKNARGARRFEEVSALTRNVEELDAEIQSLTKKVSGVEERWEGLYAAGTTGP